MTISSKFFEYALKIFFVVSTLFYLPVAGNLSGDQKVELGYMHQELFFRYGTLFLFALSLLKKPNRIFTLKHFGLFLAYIIGISIFLNFDIQSRRSILNIGLALLLFKTVVEHIEIERIKTFAYWAFWLLCANLFLCLLQVIQHDPLYQHINPVIMPDSDPIGFMRLKATLGIFAAVLSPLLFILSPWLSIISLPLLYYSESSVAVGAFVITTMFLLSYRMKKVFFLLLLSLLCAAGAYYIFFIDMPSGQFASRLFIWEHTFSHALKTSPFFGVGVGKFAAFAPLMKQGGGNPEPLMWIWAHNEFLQVFFELGIAGLTILGLYISGLWNKFRLYSENREIQSLFACFLAILLVSFFHFPFHLGKLAPMCIVLMALLHAKFVEVR